MTEDSVDMRINSLLLMRYFSLHYFVVENGFHFKKMTYVKHWGPQPDGDLIPQQAVFVSYCGEQWNVLLAPREQRPGVP